MTTLDRAFIKAFAKEAPVPRSPLIGAREERLAESAAQHVRIHVPLTDSVNVQAAPAPHADFSTVAWEVWPEGSEADFPATSCGLVTVTNEHAALAAHICHVVADPHASWPLAWDIANGGFVSDDHPAPLDEADAPRRDRQQFAERRQSGSAGRGTADMLDVLAKTADVLSHQTRQLQETTDALQLTRPVWEVDAFQFTPTVTQLLAELKDELQSLGSEVVEAAQAGLRVLGITALHPSAGRSTSVICLAQAVATAGGRVAVIDAGGPTANLAEQLGIDPPCGWNRAAAEGLPLSEAALFSLRDGWTLLPWEHHAAALSGEPFVRAWRSLLDQLGSQYDLVLVDLPVLADDGQSADEFPLPGEDTGLDAVLIVRDCRCDGLDEVERQARLLRERGISAVGMAENFVTGEGSQPRA